MISAVVGVTSRARNKRRRQQLNGFVLRHGHHWPPKKTRWTRSHYNWLESLKLEHPWQQVVLQEYIEAVRVATCRVKEITEQLMQALAQWSLAGVVDSLVALRGVEQDCLRSRCCPNLVTSDGLTRPRS